MFIKNSEGIYQSTLLLSVLSLTHGFSSRELGDMRKKSSQRNFLKKIKIYHDLTLAEQIHGNEVKIISVKDIGTNLAGADGLVSSTLGSGLVLGIRVADCVPILAVDPVTKIIGVAHAGWKGTLSNISNNLIMNMKKSGAKPADIYVCLGPHIGACCYDIDRERAMKFRQFFEDDEVISRHREKYFLNLGAANVKELRESGVLKDHIDLCPTCTFEESQEFFSYRRDDKSHFGEIIGIISYDGKN